MEVVLRTALGGPARSARTNRRPYQPHTRRTAEPKDRARPAAHRGLELPEDQLTAGFVLIFSGPPIVAPSTPPAPPPDSRKNIRGGGDPPPTPPPRRPTP